MSAADESTIRPRGRRWLVFLPLALFAALASVFLLQLTSGGDNSAVPSALIGRAAPETNLPPLPGSPLPGLSSAAFKGKVTLVNVWASWCAPCREEHPLLTRIAADKRVVLVGLNYKDRPENALGFLSQLGNPYAAIGGDRSGRAAIDWGVYGVPETYLVGRDGAILYKQVGPFTAETIASDLMPAIERAVAAP